MILQIFILLFITLLQVTFLPIDLILIILICRQFIRDEKNNYFLGFGFGLFVSFLSGQDLGIMSIIYILVLKITSMIRTSTLTSGWFFILPLTFLLIAFVEFIKSLIFSLHFNLTNIIVSMILSIPIYFLIKVWEDRFIPHKDMRLKLK